jgi:hypothetical protein
MDSLSTLLSKQQTFPSITQLFIERLTAWGNHQEVNYPKPILDFLATAYHEQTDIGWYNLVKIQSAYYTRLESRRPSQTWARNFIQRLWNISWNMWNNCNNLLYNVHTASHARLSHKLDNRVHKEFSIDINGLARVHHYMVQS